MRIPNELSLTQNGQYCLSCFAPRVERLFRDGLTYYHCMACDRVLERSLVIDDQIQWWIGEDGRYWHESVGVVVVAEKKLMVQLRQIFPFALSLPAGHLDRNEDPQEAAKRELTEETGIVAPALDVLEDSIDIAGDACRRGSDDHRWHLYRLRLEKRPEIVLSDEGSEVRWLTLEELRRAPNLVYPLAFFVDRLGERLFD